jgi:xyloglucan-specific exo-beta-1,4-glucanase
MAAFINPSTEARPGRILSCLSRYATIQYLACVLIGLPQVGGNMPGRGLGERLAVDPKLPSILYFCARSGNGLWKCESPLHFMLMLASLSLPMDSHRLWNNLVQGYQLHLAWCVFSCLFLILASLTACILGTYIQDPSDPNGSTSDIVGVSWVTFDSTSGTAGSATPRIFVGVANLGTESVFVSNDAGATCKAALRSLESLYANLL